MTRRAVSVFLVLISLLLTWQWILYPDQRISAQEDLFSPAYPNTGGSISLTVRVAQANRAPILAVYIPLGAETVSEGDHLEYGLAAADPDETVPSLFAVGLPENSSLKDSGDGTGALVFDPSFDQAGSYSVTVIASDGMLSDSVLVSLSVTETNRGPVLRTATELTTREGGHLEFGVWASDPDGTIPAFSTAQFPENATLLDSGNGAASVTFDPGYDQSGTHTITVIASDGVLSDSADVLITVSETTLPRTFSLHQNYPNPFNDATVIAFTLGEPRAGTSARARLDIVNILGQRVRTILDQDLRSGPHAYAWDGLDNSSRQVASGIYFYRLQARGELTTKKMVLLR